MSKISCSICGVPCVGCSGGRCRCGISTSSVIISNQILEENELTKEQIEKLKILSIRRLQKEVIVKALFSDEEEVEQVIKSESKGYCEYPIGSGNQGAWVKCIHCGLERFYGIGKKCSFITKE